MKIFLKIILIHMLVLFFFMNCKKKPKCWDRSSCVADVRTAVRKTNNTLPNDGIIYQKDGIYYLSYFEKQSRKIIDRYVKVNCRCDVIYFGDKEPMINNRIEFPDFYNNN